MFGKKNIEEKITIDKINTLIGKDTVFTGNISAGGTIRIDGELTGEIQTKGDVVLSEGAKVEGDVQARNMLIAGTLKGNVRAVGLVDLAQSAKLFGDLQVKKLMIEEGAVFKGNCQMETSELKQRDNTDKKEHALDKPGIDTQNT